MFFLSFVIHPLIHSTVRVKPRQEPGYHNFPLLPPPFNCATHYTVLDILATQPHPALGQVQPIIITHQRAAGSSSLDSSDPASFSARWPVQRISWWPTIIQPSSVSPTLWTAYVKSWHHRNIFLKDSVQMEREELFPSSLSFSYPSPLRPPPPPLRVLPNEALLFSMWVSYRVSAASRHQSGCL